MRVSDDALAYFEMDDSWKKREAALRMAFKPVLLAEMKTQYGLTIPVRKLKALVDHKEFSAEGRRGHYSRLQREH